MVGMGDDLRIPNGLGSLSGAKRVLEKRALLRLLKNNFKLLLWKVFAEKDGADKEKNANVGAMLVSIDAVR